MRKIDVLLLTNYRSDDQRSMLRFGNLLVENLPPMESMCMRFIQKTVFVDLPFTQNLENGRGIC